MTYLSFDTYGDLPTSPTLVLPPSLPVLTNHANCKVQYHFSVSLTASVSGC